MYGRLFEMLADQHHVVIESAHDLFREVVARGIDPADLKADGALWELDLAEPNEDVEPIDGTLLFEYVDSQKKREKDRVRAALLGEGDDDDYEDD